MCDEKTKIYVRDAVKKIATQDLELWKRWNNKNEHNIKWQRIIGEVLAGLPAEPLIVYAETIHLDMTSERNQLGIITEAFRKIPADKMDYILSVISEVVYFRWKNYLYKKKEQRGNQLEIIISAYTNIILWSMSIFIEKNNIWETEIVDGIETLEKDMYEWYEREIQMKSVFFLNVTWIFYLLRLKDYELSDIKTESVVTSVCKVRDILKRLDAFWNQTDTFKEEMKLLVNL